jgi:hypothetical protein
MTKWKLLERDGRFFARCEKIEEGSSWFLEGARRCEKDQVVS